jgi:hypothetical protein
MFLFIASLILILPDVSVNAPDSVQAGALFSCELTATGEDLSSMECVPVFSDGLQFMGSSSMHSFSSVSTPSGTSISSEIHLILSFRASYEGTHTIGPLALTSSGRKFAEIPAITVTATADAHSVLSGRQILDQSTDQDDIAWIEIDIDTTGRVYPGQTFNVDYYICKTRRNVEIVDLYLDPSDYATSRLIEDSDELNWVLCKNGVYRTWLATFEITPAFACSLSLPVLRGRIGIPGGMIRPSPRQTISTEGETIPVFPFPDSGKPDNFSGITDEISFQLEKITRGYSAAGERCLQLSVSGPGAQTLTEPPQLTLQGPAELLTGNSFQITPDSRAWYILVEPSDSGTVVVGPDSMAWFDTEREEYIQARIPACTLSVYPISTSQVDIAILTDNDGAGLRTWIITVAVLLAVVIIILLRYRNRLLGSAPDVSEAQDIEELLTACGSQLSVLLTGSESYMGSQELDEAMDKKDIDVIVSRRLLRHWKDLEMLLSGRTVSPEQLEKLRRKSAELIRELTLDLENTE